MAAKEIAYDIDARERMLRGVQKACQSGEEHPRPLRPRGDP